MRYKYFNQRLDNELTYPQEIENINSRNDLQRWFEWSSQFEKHDDWESLIKKLKCDYTINEKRNSETGGVVTEINVLFPRCKTITHIEFFGRECFNITIN